MLIASVAENEGKEIPEMTISEAKRIEREFYENPNPTEDEEQIWEVVEEEGELVIKFNDKWFRTREDFFAKACIGTNPLTQGARFGY